MNDPLLPPETTQAFTPDLTPDLARDLTRAILARTSGSPCEHLRGQACDFVDGSIDPIRSELALAHLDGCPGCSRLVTALRAAQAVLPALAQMDPGPWFTQRVLRATVHRPLRGRTDLRALGWKLMHRPRIALEAAYLGAAAGLVGISLPLPAPSISLRVPAFVQPLGASAQRVTAQVLQAERRSAATIQQSLRSTAAMSTEPRLTLWQRGSIWVRAQLQAFRRTPPPPPPKENQAGQANP